MRRVITGVNADGVAVFSRDDESPHTMQIGNFEMGEVWFDPENTISDGTKDLADGKLGSVPALGEALVRYVSFPPKAEMEAMMQGAPADHAASEDFHAESENPGMHTTETIDYGFVLEGSITLELDNGVKKVLNKGDCYIQNGTRHARFNDTDQQALIGVVMLGARRA